MNQEPEIVCEFANVTKEYQRPGGGDAVPVLRNVAFSVRAGESVAVIGPSGSGKSTLLNLAGGLDRPSTGVVRLGGQDLSAVSPEELAAVRNRDVGFVFQLHHLLPQCTVLENVLIPTLVEYPSGTPEPTLRRARTLLERVGLDQRLEHRPAQLSGGELQRVAVARALINAPRLLLADEPTGSLDDNTAAALGDLLVELNRADGVTLLVVTHAQTLANRMGRILELRGGMLSE